MGLLIGLFVFVFTFGIVAALLAAATSVLVATFEALPSGALLRRLLAVPLTALLSRQRRARRGSKSDLYQLVLVADGLTVIIDASILGVILSLLYGGLGAGIGFWLLAK